jgi:hypothetical protein
MGKKKSVVKRSVTSTATAPARRSGRLTEENAPTTANVDRPSLTRSLIREIQYLPENSMTIEQVLEGLRAMMSRCLAGEESLYEALCSEADGWKMRLEEIKNDDGSEDADEPRRTWQDSNG